MEYPKEIAKTNNHSIIITNLNKNIEKLTKNKEIWDITKKEISEIFWEEKTIFSSVNSEYILSQIETFEKNNQNYSQWHAAKIFLVEVFLWGEKKKLLIIKDLLKKDENSNAKIINEYSKYLQSYKLLSNLWNNLIQIPKPYGIMNDHEWNVILILDFIQWMTLFSFKISIVLPILYNVLKKDIWEEKTTKLLGNKNLYDNLKTDKEIKEALFKILNTFRFNNNNEFYKEYLNFFEKYNASDVYKWIRAESQMAKIYDNLSKEYNIWLLSGDNINTIQNFLIENIWILNKNNIYHNDMNQRNIILWDDWKIYIIDFDKSTDKPRKNNNNIDPKYIAEHNWVLLEWDFKIIKDFYSLKKSL